MATIYDFKVLDRKGNEVSLADYKGKVLLVVNTATACGFTPQLEDLEKTYAKLQSKGLEILNFPCNQFGEQAPGSDEDIHQFCQLNFGTKFPQFKKIEVNGANEAPLYTWLKSQKGFAGFDEHELKTILEDILSKADADWDKKSDIKWNFTKFLVNKEGEVVARFEPTHSMADVEKAIEELL
ncbi:glutathione peroxidase [Prevotella sp. DNF00663]|uniref:glutathione peroxidase n=1 Tax=unclassified Prevotella TaxID=2638335 RepID=UPI000513AF7F|nr:MULTISPECIES: glutathione peroxidase [unclassified Prevotella]KGI60614.1 glutathione peroxidase [Prevotella sp. S7 MS 2]KXB78611.1 glutathione peroxidase [Prevotella sp. DNF00663]